MKSITYDIVITSISRVHGEYPGSVDVRFHREGGNLGLGVRDGFESARLALSSAIIDAEGSVNDDEVARQVVAKLGKNETVAVDE